MRVFAALVAAAALLGVVCPAVEAQTAHYVGAPAVDISGTTLRNPFGATVSSSGVAYIGDTGNSRVLQLTPSTGLTSTAYQYNATTDPGCGQPEYPSVDSSGNVYFTCGDTTQVYKVPLNSGAFGTATALFSTPNGTGGRGTVIDSYGYLWVVELNNNSGQYAYILRCPNEGANGGNCTTYYTFPSGSSLGLSNNVFPDGFAEDSSGNFYIDDTANNVVWKLSNTGTASSPVAGTLTNIQSCPVASGQYGNPGGCFGVTVSASGVVYMGSNGPYVYKLTPNGSGGYISSTVYPPPGLLHRAVGIALDPTGTILYAADYTDNNQNLGNGLTGPSTASSNFVQFAASGEGFGSVAVGSTASTTLSLTFSIDTAGTLGSIAVLTQGIAGLDFANAGTGTCLANHNYTTAPVTCTVNVTFTPTKAGLRQGAVELLNSSGTPIATAIVFGTGTGPQVNFTTVAQTTLDTLTSTTTNLVAEGLVGDAAGNLYIVGQNALYKETCSGSPCTYTHSTLATSVTANGTTENFAALQGLAIDGAGNLYLGDGNSAGINGNGLIIKETLLSNGTYTPTVICNNNSSASPPVYCDSNQVAVDIAGNVYYLSAGTLSGGYPQVEKLAIQTNGTYSAPTAITSLSTNINPWGIAVDPSGNVFFTGANSNTLYKLTPAGSGYVQSTLDTTLNDPTSINLDTLGNIYVANWQNNGTGTLVKETYNGNLSYTKSTLVSNTTSGTGIIGVWADISGNLFFPIINTTGPTYSAAIQEFPYATPPSLTFATTNEGATTTTTTSGTNPVTLENVGNAAFTLEVPSTGTNPSVSTNFSATGSGNCSLLSTNSSTESLAAGSTCNLTVTFAPTVGGSLSGSLVLLDNNLNAASPNYTTQTIPLSGTGVWLTPTVTSVTPSYGPITGGTTVTIGGTYLAGATGVSFGGTAATIVTDTSTSMTVTSPVVSSVGSVDVTVTTPGGTSATSSADKFLYQAMPTVTLTMSSGGNTVGTGGSITSGNAIKLTATVKVGTNAVYPGIVAFCNASASRCTDVDLLGTAELTSAGTASITLIPGIGSYSYKAVFLPTGDVFTASSSTSTLTVTAASTQPTTTTINPATGSAGNYTLSATVTSTGVYPTAGPTGTVNFLDTTNSNANVGAGGVGSTLGTASVSYGFNTPTTFSTGNGPQRHVLFDYNNDGKLDLAVVNSGANTVTVYRGNGDGTFNATAVATLSVSNGPNAITAGDFNGDGYQDLAITNFNGSAFIYTGNGSGAFTLKQTITEPTNSQSIWITAGDFNNDGILDLVMSNWTTNALTVYLGNGDGTFTLKTTVSPGAQPTWITLADFNGDGNLDMALTLASTSAMQVYKGNGDGTFTLKSTPTVGTNPYGIVSADFTGDGIADLAVVNNGGPSVTILQGVGDGTFTTKSTVTVPNGPFYLALGDFNGDGIPDLAVDGSAANLTVLTGSGSGSFTTSTAASSVQLGQVLAGDLNGDGLSDIVGLNQSGSSEVILLAQRTWTATATASGVAVAGTGNHSIDASYAGDTNYAASTSSGTDTLVAGAVTTVTTLGVLPSAPVGYGTSVTLTASVSPNSSQGHTVTGDYVTFKNGATTLCNNVALNSSGQASCTTTALPASNTNSLTAVFAGDTNFATSTSSALGFTVTQATPTINFPTLTSPVSVNSSATLGATVSNSDSVTYTVTAGSATISGSTITYTNSGSVTIAASYAGNTNYTAAQTVSQTITVNPASSSYVAPATAVGGTSATQTATVNIVTAGTTNATLGTAIQVLTQGATGLDFAYVSGGTCAVNTAYTVGQTCTVEFTFTPSTPGLRMGAIELFTASGTAPIGVTYISGVGSGPLVTVTPGTISTVAGNGTQGYSGDGMAATGAELYNPTGTALDGAGNLYFVESGNNVVRKVTAATGYISTVAGISGSGAFSGDGGAATSARLSNPTGLAIDGAGNLYIADQFNYVIRKVTASTGYISTVAGLPLNYGYNGDGGAATSETLWLPAGVAVDGAGNLYIADSYNQSIRKVTASTGIMTTVAGNGTRGYSGDGAAATSAELQYPQAVTVDGAGNLYIADTYNQRIRMVTASTGYISTAAGNGTGGYSGDGAAASSAELNQPGVVAVDAAGNLYIADSGNNRIRKVTASTGSISTVAGSGTVCSLSTAACGDGGSATATGAAFHGPNGVALDGAGNLYIGDSSDNRIRKVTAAGNPVTFATPTAAETTDTTDGAYTLTLNNIGNTSLSFPTPGTGTNPSIDANFSIGSGSTCPQLTTSSGAGSLASGASCTDLINFAPVSVGSIGGSIVTTDNSLNVSSVLQSVSLSGTAIAEPASTTFSTVVVSPSPTATGNTVTVTVTLNDGSGNAINNATASFSSTSSTVSFGTPSVSGNAITVTMTDTAAETAPISVTLGGMASGTLTGSAQFVALTQAVGQTSVTETTTLIFTTAVTSSNSFTTNVLTQGAANLDFQFVSGGTCASGTAYAVGATCTVEYSFTPTSPGIRYGGITLTSTSAVTAANPNGTVANTFISGTGTGPQVVFNAPLTPVTLGGGFNSPQGVAVDGSGNVYVADYGNNLVKVMPNNCTSSSCVTTLGGGFSNPDRFAVDGSGNVYVADQSNNAVKVMANNCTSSSCVTTLGGGFNTPTSVAVDGSGNVYVADFGNSAIKVMANTCRSSSCVSTLGGGFGGAQGVAVDGSGNVYVADSINNVVKVMSNTCTSSSCVTTLAGGFSFPISIAVDGSGGNLYIADIGNNVVKEMASTCASSSCVTTLGGSFSSPSGVAVDGSGNVYVAINIGNFVKKLARASAPTIAFATATTDGNTDSTDDTQTVTIQNIGNATLNFAIPGSGVTNPTTPNDFTFTTTGGSACPSLTSSASTQGTLAAGAACDIPLTFTPVAPSTGALSESLVFTDTNLNASAATQSIALTGTATLPVPTVTSVTPNTGLIGGGITVTIGGTNFFGATTVSFGGTAATVLTETSTSITVTSPAVSSVGSVDVTVTTGGGTSATSSSDQFLYQGTPTITFPTLTSPVSVNSTDTLGAMVSDGDSVTYTVTAGSATISGSTITYTTAGSVTIAASYSGNSNYTAAQTVSQTITVNPAATSYAAPTTAVGSTSATQTATVNIATAGTLGTIYVVTQGASGLDYAAVSGGTCNTGTAYSIGQACTVEYSFAPIAPGRRLGGVLLFDNSSTPVLMGESLLSGTGTGPQALFSTPVATTLASGIPNTPRGISVDASGNVYIAESFGTAVDKFTSAGVETQYTVPSQPTGTAVDGAGNLFIAVQTYIYEVPFGSTTPVLYASGLGMVDNNLVVDSNGNLFVSGYATNDIYEVPAAAPHTPAVVFSGSTHVGGGAVSRLIVSTIDSSDKLYFVDFSNSRILEFAAGTFTPSVAISNGSIYHSQSIAVDAAGDLYVTTSSGLNRFGYSNGSYGAPVSLTGYGSGGGGGVIAQDGSLYLIQGSTLSKYVRTSTPTLNFGSVADGSTSTQQVVGLENDGNTTSLTISSLTAGNTYANFNGAGTTCSTSSPLAPGAVCNLGVEFAPTGAVSGLINGTAIVSDNSLNANGGAAQLINITGTAVANVPTASVSSISVVPGSTTGVTVTATASGSAGSLAGAVVTFSLNGSATGSFSPSTCVLDSTGTCTTTYIPTGTLALGTYSNDIQASFAPVGNYAATTATSTLTVAQLSTSTTLAITSGNNPATTVAQGAVVTLTATVANGGTAVHPGTVNFCNANASDCIGLHLLGTAQLNSSGTASISLRPGVGSYSYKAVFVGTVPATGSTSTSQSLTVTGTSLGIPYVTTTAISQSGSAGNYSLTATVTGTPGAFTPVTGTVSFLDTSNSNFSLGSAALGASTPGFATTVSANPIGGGFSAPTGVLVGDFDNDGKLDVALNNLADGQLTFYLGNGDGTFTRTAFLQLGSQTYQMVAGDFNNDGNPDIASALCYGNGVSLVLGNGDGTFGTSQLTGTGGCALVLVAGDFNGDGNLDLIDGNDSGNLKVLLGNGNGGFTTVPATVPTGTIPYGMAAGDFNGDGKLDFATANPYTNTVMVALGNGDGTFTVGTPVAVGSSPQGIGVADFNEDGNLDIVVSNNGDGTVSVLLGDGHGGFATPSTISVGSQAQSLAVADMDGDGHADIVVGSYNSSTVSVLLGTGTGTFTSTQPISVLVPAPAAS